MYSHSEYTNAVFTIGSHKSTYQESVFIDSNITTEEVDNLLKPFLNVLTDVQVAKVKNNHLYGINQTLYWVRTKSVSQGVLVLNDTGDTLSVWPQRNSFKTDELLREVALALGEKTYSVYISNRKKQIHTHGATNTA